MTETELREIYAGLMNREPKGRAGCPSPETIHDLVMRKDGEADRLATLDHVMSCRDCRGDFDLLRTIEQSGAALGEAGQGSRRRWVMPAALAASVLFAVLIGRATLTQRPSEELRSGPAGASVTLVAPETGATAGQPVTFTWRAVAGASRYRIEVLDSIGNLAVEAESPDTTATLNSVAGLAPGKYQWWVIAMTPAPGPRSALRSLHLVTR